MRRKRGTVQMEPKQRKQNKVNKKTIHLPIPGETWELVLGWLWRHNLATSTCFVPGLVGAFSMRILHEKRRRKLGPIKLDWRLTAQRGCCEMLGPRKLSTAKNTPQLHINCEPGALPECALPDNISGFQHVQFLYFNQEVLLFMRRMRPLLHNVNIILNFPITRKSESLIALAHVLPLCSSLNSLTTRLGNLCELSVRIPHLLRELRTIALKLDNRMMPVKQTAVLGEWLSTALEDGTTPKLLIVGRGTKRTELQVAITQLAVKKCTALFLAHFPEYAGPGSEPVEFVNDNTVTGNRLCAYKRTGVYKSGKKYQHWFMRCCPIADWDSAAKWLPLEEKLIQFAPNWRIYHEEQVLNFCVEKIGPIDVTVSDGDVQDAEAEGAFYADVPGTAGNKCSGECAKK